MKKNYQTRTARRGDRRVRHAGRRDLAMAELTEAVREGLLALAVGAGLQVMQMLMQETRPPPAGLRASMTPTGPPSATEPRTAR